MLGLDLLVWYIGNSNRKAVLIMGVDREEDVQGIDVKVLSEDKDLIRQVQKSREERQAGLFYDQQTGLDYLRLKIEEFERGQNL